MVWISLEYVCFIPIRVLTIGFKVCKWSGIHSTTDIYFRLHGPYIQDRKRKCCWSKSGFHMTAAMRITLQIEDDGINYKYKDYKASRTWLAIMCHSMHLYLIADVNRLLCCLKEKGMYSLFLFLLLAGVHPLLYYDCMVYDWIWKKHFLSRRQLKMEHISTIDTLLTAFYKHAVILFWISVFFWLQLAHTWPLFIVNYTLIYLLMETMPSVRWLSFCHTFSERS